MGEEQEPIPRYLPTISAETKNKIFGELGIEHDQKTIGILQGITGRERKIPSEARRELAKDIFSTLVDVNEPLVTTLHSGIKEGLKFGHDKSYRTSCIEGMAFVLRAFDIESEYRLLPSLDKIKQEDLPLVKQLITEGLKGGGDYDLIEEILQAPRIPQMQIELNEIVEKGKNVSVLAINEFVQGAGVMYKLLNQLNNRYELPFRANNPNF